MARNVKPNEMVESVLFKSLAPSIHSISQSQLLYELCVATNHADVRIDLPDVNAAFTWDQTPQRSDFWSPIYNEWLQDGEREYVGEDDDEEEREW